MQVLSGGALHGQWHACTHAAMIAGRACWRLEQQASSLSTLKTLPAGVGGEACAPTVRCSRSCFGPLNMKKNVREALIGAMHRRFRVWCTASQTLNPGFDLQGPDILSWAHRIVIARPRAACSRHHGAHRSKHVYLPEGRCPAAGSPDPGPGPAVAEQVWSPAASSLARLHVTWARPSGDKVERALLQTGRSDA